MSGTRMLEAKLSNILTGMEHVAGVGMESGSESCRDQGTYHCPSKYDRQWVLEEVENLKSKASISIDFVRTKVVQNLDGIEARENEDTASERYYIGQTSMAWSWQD
jgi:hypothetical protein